MSNKHTYKVNVVAYEAEGVWFAQCVEFDISAWADDVLDLPEAFTKKLRATCAVNAHLGRNGLEGIPPAPSRFRDMLNEASYDLRPRHRDARRPIEIESFGLSRQAAQLSAHSVGKWYRVGEILSLFQQMGCEIAHLPRPVVNDEGEVQRVRYIMNPETRRFATVVDGDDDRIPETEVRNWMRQVGMEIPLPGIEP